MRRSLSVIALLAASAACFPRASIPQEERQRAAQELEGRRLYFQVAVNVGPLYGDTSKLLVSDQPFGELELLETPDGRPMAPPAAERVLPPGTPAYVTKVEFPTGMIIASRVVMSPRYHPWVYLEAAGEPRPLVLVLSQTVSSAEGARAELERVLGPTDPSAGLRTLPDLQRSAVGLKKLVEGMEPHAVEMSWGQPERKVLDRPARTEDWYWAGDRRRARFQEERLATWEQR